MPDRSLTCSRAAGRPAPPQSAWFQRLPKILDVLTHMDASHHDHDAVEHLFGVGHRRARQWMAGLAGIRAGNAVAVSRITFIERIEETGASSPPAASRSPYLTGRLGARPGTRPPPSISGPASSASRSPTPLTWPPSWWIVPGNGP